MENLSFTLMIRSIQSRISTVVFDYDGVIVDSVVKSKKIIITTALKHDLKISLSDLKEFDGLSWPEMFPKLGEKLSWPKDLCLIIEKESTEKALNTAFKMPKNLPEKLEILKSFGLKIGILTNRTESSLKFSAKLAGLDLSIFNFIGTFDNLKHKKPCPTVWDDLWRNKAIPYIEGVLFLGDTVGDYFTTKHKVYPVMFFGITNSEKENNFAALGVSQSCIFKETISAVDFVITVKEQHQAL